jgi:uncharacterized protein YcgL (UPF0745 family)
MSYRVDWIEEGNFFKVLKDENEYRFKYILKPITEYKDREFLIYIFLKKYEYAENDVYEIHDKNLYNSAKKDEKITSKIGFLFPIRTLLSLDNDYATKDYFLKYAFAAYFNLIKESDSLIGYEMDGDKEYIDLNEIYGEDIFILIIDKNNLKQLNNFDIHEYLISLYKFGYYIIDNLDDIYRHKEKKQDEFLKIGKKIKIEPIPECLKEYEYIEYLIKTLNNDMHYLVKFHLLYQIIELLIERIMNKEMQKVAKNFDISISGRETMEKLQNISTEKYRINLLFSDVYKNGDLQLNDLKNSCNELLELIDKKKDNVGSALYCIRNYIFHNYRSLKTNYIPLLEKINLNFETEIINIILNYKED